VKTYKDLMAEGYTTKFLSKIGKYGSANYKIVHNETGEHIGRLSIDKISGEHHIHLHDGRGFTIQPHELGGKDPQSSINHFLKQLNSGNYKPDSSRKFGPFDWKGDKK